MSLAGLGGGKMTDIVPTTRLQRGLLVRGVIHRVPGLCCKELYVQNAHSMALLVLLRVLRRRWIRPQFPLCLSPLCARVPKGLVKLCAWYRGDVRVVTPPAE